MALSIFNRPSVRVLVLFVIQWRIMRALRAFLDIYPMFAKCVLCKTHILFLACFSPV
ncbi:Uncharacterized protein APZ42_019540 [Daphnia magna]|uniref:Uncharacterized protein n=1 Tax=Daphnia magna TaxID=35525 RepID=A0A0P5ZQX3_9CRUS|nr:Uncharacterized protein APZ42_019540 [Daphnia magna]